MRVIDLLNKISNGEEVPKIKYSGTELKYNKKYKWFDYIDNREKCISFFDLEELNNEVEVIEDKKIEKVMGIDTRETRDCIITFQEKLNELIEEVNKLKESK